MRFFTPAWLDGELPDDVAEQIPATYSAHLTALGPDLPHDAHRLNTDVSLHDGLLQAVDRAASRLELVIRAGDQVTGYFDARLAYEDARLTTADERFLSSAIRRHDIELLYDEFDSADSHWVHRLLFWPYYDVTVQFRTFTLAVTRRDGRTSKSR